MPSPPNDDRYAAYLNQIVGAAVFDWNGLPKEYFTTQENTDIGWVQTVFQVLGLRSLLMSSLRLEGFHYVAVHSEQYHAVIIKQRDNYVALLIQSPKLTEVNPGFLEWAQSFDYGYLRKDPRFQMV